MDMNRAKINQFVMKSKLFFPENVKSVDFDFLTRVFIFPVKMDTNRPMIAYDQPNFLWKVSFTS